eukprot:4322725-Pyramimonas_sp.AAC.1
MGTGWKEDERGGGRGVAPAGYLARHSVRVQGHGRQRAGHLAPPGALFGVLAIPVDASCR